MKGSWAAGEEKPGNIEGQILGTYPDHKKEVLVLKHEILRAEDAQEKELERPEEMAVE